MDETIIADIITNGADDIEIKPLTLEEALEVFD